MLTDIHKEGFRKRGLSPDLAETLGFRSMGSYLGIDYRLKGEVFNTKIRRGKGDMPWEITGKPLILWNCDVLQEEVGDDPLIITEGEFDAAACIQAGFKFVTSVPNGAPGTAGEEGINRYKYLFHGDNLLPELEKFSQIILAVDGDDKGQYLRDALAVRLGDERCSWVAWPEGCKDANDVTKLHGDGALVECIFSAKRMWTDEVCRLSDIPDPPEERSLHVGIPELVPHLKLPEKGLMTVMGPYESGKSTFMRFLCFNMVKYHKWKVLITCFEETAKWRTVNVFRKLFSDMPARVQSQEQITEADNWIEENIIFLQKKPRGTMDAARLLDRIEYAIKAYGVNMVIIDPFNMIDHSWNPSRGKTKADYISDVLKEFHDIAADYRVLVCVVAHPPASQMRHNNSAKHKFYTLADVADAAAFANHSDIGLCIWQNDGRVMLNIDKIKNQELCGKPTGVELRLDVRTDKYSVVALGWEVFRREDE